MKCINKNILAIKLSSSIKLYFILVFMPIMILIAGTYGIGKLKMMTQITGTIYTDRLIPIEQLSTIRFSYGTKLLFIISEIKNHQLTYEQAKIQLEESEQKGNSMWKAYLRTFLTQEEKVLIRETNVMMGKADPALAKLKIILSAKDSVALDDFVLKDLPRAIIPVTLKINELIELQIKVSEEKFRISNEIYHTTQRNLYIFLILSLLLGFYIIMKVRFFIKKLKISNRKIIQSENKFREFIKYAGDSIFMIDSKFHITEMNDSACNLLNYSEEELLNMKIYELMTETDQLLFPVSTKIVDEEGGLLHERKLTRKDGSLVDVEVNVRSIEGIGYIAIIRDITQRKHSETKIKESEEKFRMSFMTSHDAFYIGSLNKGHIIDVNDSFCDIFGYTKEEIIGKTILDLNIYANPEDRTSIIEGLKTNGYVKDIELMCRKKSGEPIFTSISGNIFQMNDELVCMAVIRDITERKKTEVIIKEQSDIFAAIIENANESICLLSPDLKVLQFNKTAKEKLLANRAKEIYLGANFKEYLHIGTENVFMPMFNDALTGKYTTLESYQKDIHGNSFWLRTKMYPIYDTLNELIGVTVLSENITDRKKIETQLEQSEERNRSLIENISDSIVLINDNWEMVYQSPSYVRTSGFSFKEHKGKTVLDIMYPDDVQRGRKIIEKAKASPKTATPFQLRILHKKGHFIWIEGTITNLLQNDSVKAYVLNYRDITLRKLMESERLKITSEILQRNRDLEQFAYIISHNLRAPVANIIGITDYLKDKDIDQAEKDQMSDGLIISARALDVVIHDLNTILQTKQEINEKKETVKFSEILENVKLSVATLIKNNQVVFYSDFSEIDEMVSLKSYMHSIFYNLVSNSIKFRQPEITPIIKIKSKLTENKIELIFKDNGVGIDLKKNSDQIFGLYKRFHTHVEGKGMGLYMVKTQVETLGGKISMESKPYKETKFIIKFKIKKNN